MTEIEYLVKRGFSVSDASSMAAGTRSALVRKLQDIEERKALASVVYVGVTLLVIAATIGISCARYWYGRY